MREKKAQKLLEQTKEIYEKIGDEFSRSRNYIGSEVEVFDRYVKNGLKIMDLGCGNGRIYPYFKDKNVHYLGIDQSESLLKNARNNNPEAEFVAGNMAKIPLNDSSFDMVICLRSFHHLPDLKTRNESLNEIKRVLKKDGIVIITVWNLWQISNLFLFLKSIFQNGFKHLMVPWGKEGNRYYYAFTMQEFKKLTEKKFKIIEAKKIGYDYLIVAKNA